MAACNIDVYNEALRIRWETYRDLYQLETLVSEIDVNGLNGDSVTSDVLSSVDSYYSQLKIESEADPDHVTLLEPGGGRTAQQLERVSTQYCAIAGEAERTVWPERPVFAVVSGS